MFLNYLVRLNTLILNVIKPITLKIKKIFTSGFGENKFNKLNPLKYLSSNNGRLNGLNVKRNTLNKIKLTTTTFTIDNTFFITL
jgi:hypothetical protein